ncbi:hypothetical protein ABBQ38_004636 [Trebouxia sp. C0009 RCD-2024]
MVGPQSSKLWMPACFDRDEKNVRSSIRDHTKAVTSIHCSPDDKHFASGSLSGEIWLHRVHDDGAAVRLPTDGTSGKLCVQFAPLDTLLVSSCQDGSLNTWDVATRQATDSYRMLHKAAASSVSFLTASHVLASAGLDEQIKLLDRRSNSVAASVSTKQPLHSMACRDDGNTIAVGTSDGTVLLYDPRKLVTPWDQTTCSGSHVIKDLHWQHTSSSKVSRTAVKAGSQDSHAARASAEQNGATSSARGMQAHAAPVFATPAPAPHAAANNAAMAVFSPLDTNVIPGFQYNSSSTPPSSFPQGGVRAALASWPKKPAEQAANTPTATLSGAGRQADKQEASTSQMMSAELQTPADTPTLTFPTPSLRLQQRTPVLTGPAVLQPMSPAVSHAAAASGPTASSTAPGNAPLTGAFPISPLPLTVPSANAPEPAAMPNSPVHGVWNRKTQAASHDQPAAAVFSGSADRGTTTNLADVAAELLPETPHLPGRLVGQQAGYMGPMQEHVFDHRSLLTPAEPQSAALLAAVQQELEERLMSLREDMQASQQHITQQFAQHQGELLQVVEAVASKQDSMAARLDQLTDQLQQLLTKQSSIMLL